ncbi:MAG TPA: UDP-N-acetylmuramoyl-L-alanine--D-glutamate ligase, partial [Frankiaceae bacterium]|nr:UDP-N-acetylmuramoyl-L-alanine--D-glutamate ligase [Frankiaceae bacterium]
MDPGWPGRRVAVVGAGVSGVAAARHLLALGAAVTVLDAADGPRQRAAAAELARQGARVRLGGLPPVPDGVDLVVTSPGVPPSTPFVANARVPVWGEAELAWRLTAGTTWLVVTGTNGKTTTTRMLGAILAAAGRRAATAGNIGTPLVDAVTAEPPYEVLAVELSSFQLHYASTPVPFAAAVLNVAPDHLDWHGDLAAYAAAKAKAWADPGTIAIGNADDEGSRSLLAAAPGRRVTFGLSPTADLAVVDGVLVDRAFGGGPLLAAAELAVPGPHNLANALVAAALARAYGVGVQAVRDGLVGVRAGAHRNAPVATAGGVAYVDDSKATNPHAAAASLAAYPRVVWIAGGLNKGLGFDDLVRG